ncbi:MAG: hypothetical protein A2Z25_09655 [Planctomycetes bacterium RBG_16_55_9]|nr:MAG: hypothetical protein A2Z25_09655 [Planctomycetes bacterium RBG_16_55_9]
MKYPWRRFWCPREGVMNLSDGGFLYDPEGEHAEWIQSDVVPFEKITHIPCLALLGEPGIGKSTAMEDLKSSSQESITSSGNGLLYLNLNEYGEENRLIDDLFRCEMFLKWKQGNHQILHLFLDSLDECHIQIPHVATILINHFRVISENLGRLHLRIVCRTAEWPATLEQSLPELWGKDRFGVYELCPLRRKDVQEALRMECIDADKFRAEIERTESVAFAFKPATLRFLISVFRSEKRLPDTRTELYEKGCRILCEELNPSRLDLRAVGGAGVLSAEERLDVASRIAAVNIFCRKTRIFTDTPVGPLVTEQITVSELEGVEAVSPTRQRAVSAAHIRETLGTGLFSSRGASLMGFAHQTYAEFLASRYLRLHDIPAKKILAILRHSGDSEAHIVPQLYETAAWIASQKPEMFAAIARNEPQVLLRCDEGALSAEQRAILTQSYLEALNDVRTDTRDWVLYHHYHKLFHPGIHDQLCPWITDDTKNVDARHAAIDIAEACKVTSLQTILADLALNENETEYLRSNAAHAIARIGDSETRQRLRPLAFGRSGPDLEDQLKGNALRALWPDIISAEELFAQLEPPKRQSFFGAYHHFVEYELTKHIDISSLPYALQWLEGHAQNLELGFPFETLADDIMIAAWRHMEDPNVLNRLASASIKILECHHYLVANKEKRSENESLFDDVTKRRRLSKAIVEKGLNTKRAYLLGGGWGSPRLLNDGDFEWCVQELNASILQSTESTWASLVWTLFRWTEPSGRMLNVLVDARAKSAKLKEESASFFTPVPLNSEQAKKMRNDYEQSQRWQQKKEPKLLEWLPKDRIQNRLRHFEEGKLDAWWVLLREMTLEDTSEKYEHLFEPDIRKLPGWMNSDLNTRNRILDAAESYLSSKCLFDRTRLLDGSADEQDIAGYKAFLLLMNERPENLLSLSEDVWTYWAPIFFGPFGYNGNSEFQKILISMAYEKAPESVITRLKEIIQHEIGKEDHYISVLELVENIWDQHISSTVFSMLEEAQVKPSCWGRILHALLKHGDESAFSLAEDRLSLPLPQAESDRTIALQAALVMMQSKDDAAWPIIWPVLQAEQQFGREVILELAGNLSHDYAGFFSRLSENQIADLYIWLVQQFPYSEDRRYDGDYSPTNEDYARDMRRAALNALEKGGTPESFQAVQRISETLTELNWLKNVLLEARKNTLQTTWRPLEPKEFLEITSKPESVLVRNATELQEALVEALGALESLLQGKYAAPDLWDKQSKERFRPKDENHFSDWIARNLEPELKKRGIVVAREVQTRRGEKTDIHVTAIVSGLAVETYDQVRVIIEAKGCWHPELKSAMKSQLVDRYLKDNKCNHGIYLVGWYACAQWEEEDRRKTATPNWSFQKAREFFEDQAQELSAGGYCIRAVVLNTALR